MIDPPASTCYLLPTVVLLPMYILSAFLQDYTIRLSGSLIHWSQLKLLMAVSHDMQHSTPSICRCQKSSSMHATNMPHLSPSAGTQINKATNPLRTNWKAPAVQNTQTTLQTFVPVARRRIHICPRHSQLSVIAHAITWVCTFFSLFPRDSLVYFLLLPYLSSLHPS